MPFVQSYITSNLFFSFCFAALDCDNDPDIEAPGLGRVGNLSLQVWRQSVGKLAFMWYPYVLNNEEEGFYRWLNIRVIWILYFLQIMWMFTMMLNFMIAVIEDTYADVENLEDILISKGKAELNMDYFELKEVFFKLNPYRILLFTTDIAVQKGHS